MQVSSIEKKCTQLYYKKQSQKVCFPPESQIDGSIVTGIHHNIAEAQNRSRKGFGGRTVSPLEDWILGIMGKTVTHGW